MLDEQSSLLWCLVGVCIKGRAEEDLVMIDQSLSTRASPWNGGQASKSRLMFSTIVLPL